MQALAGAARKAPSAMLDALAFAAAQYAAIDAAGGRLPKNVVPVSYRIELDPDRRSGTIRGREEIVVVVRAATNTIVANALDTTFESLAIDGRPAHVAFDPEKQQVRFTAASQLAAGTHTIDAVYTAKLQHSDQGLFVQSYTGAEGKPAYMYATQFEASDARRAFPSFDEPVFKARFTLSAIVPKGWTAVSNMPIAARDPAGPDRTRVRFATTPPMSSYLVVFAAGDFDALHGKSDGVRLNVYTPHGKASQGAYALLVMEKLMPYLDAYYGVKYPLPKLDAIAIPGSFSGAMENWGGITYVEPSLLFDPATDSASARRDIFTIVAHEESHMWNGDLTTMAWWDELWLNEGFATWMESKAPAHFHPDWPVMLDVQSDVDRAMHADAMPSTHPIYVSVHDEAEADAVFDDIVYEKAGALLRMLERYLGEAAFARGVRAYFHDHQYGTASAADLWRSLGAATGQDVGAIAHAWVYEPGFPLVSAAQSCTGGRRTLTITQQRFSVASPPPPSDAVWNVPMQVRFDARKSPVTPLLLTAKTASFDAGACASNAPVTLNAAHGGFYRVAYDADMQRAQQAAFLALPVADRIGLLDDAWALAENGSASLGSYLAYVQADRGDRDPRVVDRELATLGQLLDYERGQPGEAAFERATVAAVRPILAAFGGWSASGASDDALRTRNRALLLLARCGDAATIAQAGERFARTLKNPKPMLRPLDREAIVDVAGLWANAATYDRLLALARKAGTQSEQELYFGAALSARNDVLARESLAMALDSKAGAYAADSPDIVLAVAAEHPKMAWDFVNAHASEIFGGMAQFDAIQLLQSFGTIFWSAVTPDDMQRFLQAHAPGNNAGAVASALETVRVKQAIRSRLLPQIDAYAATKENGPAR